MGQLSVVHWKRYGKHRLYVNGPDGARVGWHDLQSGESHLDVAELRAEFELAIAGEIGGRDVPDPRPGSDAEDRNPGLDHLLADREDQDGPVPEPAPSRDVLHPIPDDPGGIPAVPDPGRDEWEDLAECEAGALVRARAQALRDEAPVRTLLARVLRVHTDERAFRIGADGEEKVGSRLQKLAKKDPRWRSVNSVPVGQGSSDIDHVVIGPAGVFTLNTKHHPGRKLWVGGDTFMVGGHRQPYVWNSRHEARRASQLLTAAAGVPVAVRGVIVIADAEDMTIKAQPADVLVLWRQALVRWLRGLPEVLDEATTDAIYDVARRSTTWRPSAGQ